MWEGECGEGECGEGECGEGECGEGECGEGEWIPLIFKHNVSVQPGMSQNIGFWRSSDFLNNNFIITMATASCYF